MLKYGDENIDKVFRGTVFQEQFKRKKGEEVPQEAPEETVPDENAAPETDVVPGANVPTEKAEAGVPMEPGSEEGAPDENAEEKPELKNKKELKRAEEFTTYDVDEFLHMMETELNVGLNELESRILKKAQVLTKNFPQDKRVEIMHRLNDYFDEKIDYIKVSLMRMIDKAKRGI
jgi:hypothetical protein